jgi:hypothetical protein
VDFAGTALMPEARGYAEVSGEKGYMRIDARFDELQPPTRFGPEYLTYVMWAITPEGRATNLGEVQRDDKDARIKVTTELQAFGMIVTAEPYFAVTQPSDVVVIENVVRDGTKGEWKTVQAKYELLKRGTYLMNQDPSQLRSKPLEPGAPLDLAEARNAVALARIAGADRYAADTFNKANALLSEAEVAREKHKRGNDVMQPARQAAQTAEDARIIALQRQEEEYTAQQRALAAQRERDALDRARAEEARAKAEAAKRQQAELDAQAAAQAKAAADRERLEVERARQKRSGEGRRRRSAGGSRDAPVRRRMPTRKPRVSSCSRHRPPRRSQSRRKTPCETSCASSSMSSSKRARPHAA